jgi:hypothetical protein
MKLFGISMMFAQMFFETNIVEKRGMLAVLTTKHLSRSWFEMSLLELFHIGARSEFLETYTALERFDS